LKLQFSKYHGTGNDFIMIDSRKNVMRDRSPARIGALCDRHFGIGADGLIILEESEVADFRMAYYNSDGHPGTMCGNGGRCTALFAKRSGWVDGDCRFEAADGLHSAFLLPGNVVRLEMGDVGNIQQVDEGFFLDTGSPHLVIFVDDVEKTDVFTLGRRYRMEARFRGGTNVNFVQKGGDGIFVRTYERGVEDETLSCGTGVTAAAMAAFLSDERYGNAVSVKTRGGDLRVEFRPSAERDSFSGVFLSGPVTEVFDGYIKLDG
jgi:diaminopimelate epimerase